MGVRRCSWRGSTPPERRPCAPWHGGGFCSDELALARQLLDHSAQSQMEGKRPSVHKAPPLAHVRQSLGKSSQAASAAVEAAVKKGIDPEVYHAQADALPRIGPTSTVRACPFSGNSLGRETPQRAMQRSNDNTKRGAKTTISAFLRLRQRKTVTLGGCASFHPTSVAHRRATPPR